MARILVADDERDFRRSVAEVLAEQGHEVREAGDTPEALREIDRDPFDLVLSDLRMPGPDGLALLRAAAERMPDAVLVVLTAYGSLDVAIEALRVGAHDFLLKPITLQTLVHKVDRLLRHQATLAENRFLRRALERDVPAGGLVGASAQIAELSRLIARVAAADSTVLVTGETGTGKEVVARELHRQSPRQREPFVAINCGSIPETLLESELFGHVRGAFSGADRDKQGLLEVAGTGTLLLDEIGEMPLPLQPKMLRALESREFLRVGSTAPSHLAARVLATTHRDLTRMIEEGSFRADLYYRLGVLELHVPPLRERPDDVRPLTLHLLERLRRRMNVPVPVVEPEAWSALERYAWPGNVRELANVIERALILSEEGRIGLADLPGVVQTPGSHVVDDLRAARRAFEVQHVRAVLRRYGGDKRRAAEALGIDLSSVYRHL